MAQLLVDARAAVNAAAPEPTYELCTALHAAVMKGNVEVAQLLVDAGANVNASVEDLHTAACLLTAVENGNVEVAQLLVDAGADVNASVKVRRYLYGGRQAKWRCTTLHVAADNGNLEMAKLLIDAGADVTPACRCPWSFGYTALCANEGNVEVAQLLVDLGVDVNAALQLPYEKDTDVDVARERGDMGLDDYLAARSKFESKEAQQKRLPFYRGKLGSERKSWGW